MKKKYLLLFILFIFKNSYGCTLLNEQYNFNYFYDEKTKVFSYDITKKDNSKIYFYSKNNNLKDIGLGISVISSHKFFETNIQSNILQNKFNEFYTENGYLISHNLFDTMAGFSYTYPLKESFFIYNNKIHDSWNLNKFILLLQRNSDSINLPNNTQLIKIKVKVILDHKISKCLVFESKEIKLDFGNKYLIIFNNWLANLIK